MTEVGSADQPEPKTAAKAPRLVPILGAELGVADWGPGEPVVLIQTALAADEFRPLAEQAVLGDYRKIVYHRRGYGTSSLTTGPGSVSRDAADCQALAAAIGIERVHVVGLSYSAAVALQLAVDAPGLVHTLTLIEPPPVHTPSAAEFRAANEDLIEIRRTTGTDAAVDHLLSRAIGPDWREGTERNLPGATAQMTRDAATFLDTDLPALLAWRFDANDARRISCPVLHIGGSDSGAWFAEVRTLVLQWLPHAEDVVIAGADHGLAISHASEVAEMLAAFLRRHPIRL